MTYRDVVNENEVFAEHEQARVERVNRESELYNYRLENNIVVATPRLENNIHTL